MSLIGALVASLAAFAAIMAGILHLLASLEVPTISEIADQLLETLS